jgi:hypothetical protein
LKSLKNCLVFKLFRALSHHLIHRDISSLGITLPMPKLFNEGRVAFYVRSYFSWRFFHGVSRRSGGYEICVKVWYNKEKDPVSIGYRPH